VDESRLREIPGVGDARLLVHTRTDHGANPNFARSPRESEPSPYRSSYVAPGVTPISKTSILWTPCGYNNSAPDHRPGRHRKSLLLRLNLVAGVGFEPTTFRL
jgi:hypothetical protein